MGRVSWYPRRGLKYRTGTAEALSRDLLLKTRRLFDIAFVILTLPVTIPLGLMVAVAVFVDSPGPIFYRSVRIGKGGKPFAMLKFRKMRNEAEGSLLTQV